jgi:hypothetical protein
MSLITEDGAGRADAEALATVAQADAHHAARGNSLWATITTEEKEQAIRRATDYLSGFYRTKWKGARATTTQALDWPRIDVQLDDVGFGRLAYYVPYNTVPAQVVQACAEIAFKAAQGELAPDLQRQVIAKTVGPIRTEYAQGTPEYVRYRSVDLLLKPLLCAGGTGAQLVRA